MHLAAFAQLLPPIAGVATGRLATPARRWVVVWCLGLGLADAVSLLVALRWGENLFVSYIFLPLTGSAALWAFSLWQTTDLTRLTLRLAIPLFVAVSVVLSVVADDARSFSLFAAPYHAVVMLIAASWTFVRRSLNSPGALLQQDWFWVAGGCMLYFGSSTAMQPLVSYLFASGRDDLIMAAFNLRATLEILASIAIAGGMLCPIPLTSSGGSSSPPFSPWPFSSAPSGRPW
jgi:hypothetical protein